MKKIIGILGHIGSGKDTAAKFYIETQNYKKISFADTLKDVLSVVFSWDRTMLEGTTAQSRNWRNIPDLYWSTKLGFEVTPRKMLQQIGTDLFRNHLSPVIWSSNVELKILNSTSDIVVSDVRFEEEYNKLKELGAVFIRIDKETLPEWEPIALRAILGSVDDIRLLKEMGIHESEWKWMNFTVDYTIVNDGSIADLRNKLANLAL